MPRQYYRSYSYLPEMMREIGGPYYNPYSSAPIDIGMTLRQNLAQIAAYKQYEREMQATRQQQDFENWVKTMQVQKMFQEPKPSVEEQLYGELGEEERRAAAKKKYLPAEERQAYPPEVRANIEKQLGLPVGTLATAPDAAVTQALGEQWQRTRPEKAQKEKEPKLSQYQESVLSIKRDYDKLRMNAQDAYRKNVIKINITTKEGQIQKAQLDQNLNALMLEITQAENKARQNLMSAWGRKSMAAEELMPPESPAEAQASQANYQLVGYDKDGNPLYRGPDGKLYRKQ